MTGVCELRCPGSVYLACSTTGCGSQGGRGFSTTDSSPEACGSPVSSPLKSEVFCSRTPRAPAQKGGCGILPFSGRLGKRRPRDTSQGQRLEESPLFQLLTLQTLLGGECSLDWRFGFGERPGAEVPGSRPDGVGSGGSGWSPPWGFASFCRWFWSPKWGWT